MDYVPESRFGDWFQGTDVWRRYVVEVAIAELVSLLPETGRSVTSVLDVGCGGGVAFERLLAEFPAAQLTGIDISPKLVGLAQRTAEDMKRVRVQQADATRLPLATGSVDLVLCHQLLHHASDPPGVVEELRRVLAPQGWLLVAESCRYFLDWWPVRLLFRHPSREQLTAQGYAALLRAGGFEVGPSKILTPAPWWSLPDLGVSARLGRSPLDRPATQVRIAALRGV